MPEIDKEIWKAAVKEAIREWLDDAYRSLGKWTLKGVGAMAFAGIVYLSLTAAGWKK